MTTPLQEIRIFQHAHKGVVTTLFQNLTLIGTPGLPFKERSSNSGGSVAVTIIGYGRVSTREQNPQAQEAELREAGAQRVFIDHGESSRTADRPEWVACLD